MKVVMVVMGRVPDEDGICWEWGVWKEAEIYLILEVYVSFLLKSSPSSSATHVTRFEREKVLF